MADTGSALAALLHVGTESSMTLHPSKQAIKEGNRGWPPRGLRPAYQGQCGCGGGGGEQPAKQASQGAGHQTALYPVLLAMARIAVKVLT